MEIQKITEENVRQIYSPCGPDFGNYIEEKTYLSELIKGKLSSGWKGFIAKENEKVVGRIEIQPAEISASPLTGSNHYYLPCVWVLPEYQKRGIGKILLERMLNESKDRAGVITFAMKEVGWMPESFFKKFGFEETDLKLPPFSVLLKKNFNSNLPQLAKPSFEHKKNENAVVIEIVEDMMCPYFRVWQNELMKTAQEYGNKVQVIKIKPKTREEILKYGSGNIFVDGAEPFVGPAEPDEIKRVIEEKLKDKKIKLP